jgi:putative FmdB family regulatory protein
MPMYEYKCQGCGQVFELLQRFSDEPLTTHEACGGAVERLISAPGLHFKGSGWYITDYARGGGASPANSAKNGGSESGSGESKSGESKSSDSKSGDSKPAASTSTSSSSSSSDKK